MLQPDLSTTPDRNHQAGVCPRMLLLPVLPRRGPRPRVETRKILHVSSSSQLQSANNGSQQCDGEDNSQPNPPRTPRGQVILTTRANNSDGSVHGSGAPHVSWGPPFSKPRRVEQDFATEVSKLHERRRTEPLGITNQHIHCYRNATLTALVNPD